MEGSDSDGDARMAAIQVFEDATAVGWQEALRRWLQWNEAYERLTERMFQVKEDRMCLEALADQLDDLRQQALAASRAALRSER